MISLDKISFSYPGSAKAVFQDLSLNIARGTWVVIGGPDGSGKTTLCKLVKGLLRPTAGSVIFQAPLEQTRVGYLGGDPYDCLVGISVAEDVIFGLENLNLSQQEMERRLEEVLRWTELSGMEERLVHTLSGGEQQKLAFAGALAGGADVVVIDEALNMLDKAARRATFDLLESLRKERTLTIIEAASARFQSAADRIVFISNGTILSDSGIDAFMASELGSRWLQLISGSHALRQRLSCLRTGLPPLDLIAKSHENGKS
jgi:energy-coupling factor transport system ATP-binding protein